MADTVTEEGFFAEFDEARGLFEVVRAAVEEAGTSAVRVTRSQITFARRRAFAWVWVPDRYLQGGHAPLVLSVSLPRRDDSARWKQVVEPAAGRFMHHLEIRDAKDVDDEVRAWIREAWEGAA